MFIIFKASKSPASSKLLNTFYFQDLLAVQGLSGHYQLCLQMVGAGDLAGDTRVYFSHFTF